MTILVRTLNLHRQRDVRKSEEQVQEPPFLLVERGKRLLVQAGETRLEERRAGGVKGISLILGTGRAQPRPIGGALAGPALGEALEGFKPGRQQAVHIGGSAAWACSAL
jgi:hypothetical protein